MATYQTRKAGTAARQQTIARRAQRAAKAGSVAVNRAGHVKRSR